MGNQNMQASINVTPLIDVLLVLLIVFMVIVPTRSVGLAVRAPQQQDQPAAVAERALVITVFDDGGAMLNRERLASPEWPQRLRTVLASRADRTVFFTASADTEFRHVGQAIDAARASGASQVGLLAKPE